MTRKLSTLILRAAKVSSGTAIAAARDVSLKSEMIVEDNDGSTLRNINGAMMELRICAEYFRQISSGIQGKHQNETLQLVEAEAHLRQREVGEKHQDEDRQVADHRDIDLRRHDCDTFF